MISDDFLSPPVQVAQWAHMRHFLSVVCLDLTEKGENNSYRGQNLQIFV